MLEFAGLLNNELRAIYTEMEQVAAEASDDDLKGRLLQWADQLRDLCVVDDSEEGPEEPRKGEKK